MNGKRFRILSLGAVVAFLGCSAEQDSTDSSRSASSEFRYPQRFTDERDLPAHEEIRAEGASRLDLVNGGVSYFEKYFKKKYSAPHEAFPHFDAQRAMWADLERAEEPRPGAVRLGMVGDVMWIKDQWDSFLGDDVRDTLASYDVVVGNLESPIVRGAPVPSAAADYVAYNSAPGLVRSFRKEGRSLFSALSIANNHTFDMGDDGARATMALLAEEGVPSSGVRPSAASRPFTVMTAGDLRFGYYATTFGFNDADAHRRSALVANTIAGLSPEPVNTHDRDVDLGEVARALEAMDQEHVDVKIVSVHWGHEFELYPTALTMQVARRIVALGADVIVGAHPHVVQPAEICLVNGHRAGLPPSMRAHPGIEKCDLDAPGRPRKALVLYSLGNFATNMWGFLCELGMVASVEFFRDARGVADWRAPRHLFVHNRRASPAGRKLELLSTFLAGRCGGSGCSPATLAFADFAERHVTGAHVSRAEAARLKDLGAREGRDAEGELHSFAREIGFDLLAPLVLSRLD